MFHSIYQLLIGGTTPDTRALVYATLIGGGLALVGAIIGAGVSGTISYRLDRVRENTQKTMDEAERLRQRIVKHYNALATIQWQFNEARAILEDNQTALDELLATGIKGLLTPKRPQLLRIDYDHYTALTDIKFINLINDHNYSARRLNWDMENLTRAVDQLEGLLLSGQINSANYAAHVKGFEEGILALKKGLLDAHGEVLTICAYARICADKDATPEMKEQFKKATAGKGPYSDEEVAKVKTEIEKELSDQENEDIKRRGLKRTGR